ncbi:MAG: hypothetical protein JSU63_14070 [Phycisphaerales bacterium]|nr:MAG: hypothetical protein JSU63_14070 [Phycisphaerales bacterium]
MWITKTRMAWPVLCVIALILGTSVPAALAQLSECETDILRADDGAAGDRFGRSSAVSGDYAFFGAYYAKNEAAVATGAVYMFRRNEVEWSQQQKLAPGPEEGTLGMWFGIAQAVSEDLLIVGANKANEGNVATPATPSTGAAYVFHLEAGSWVEETKLVASDGETDDRFGGAVAIDGGMAVVGAPWRSSPIDNAGVAYFFRRDVAGWVQIAKKIAPISQANSEFGGAVAISGDWAAVGAPLHDDPNFCGPIATCNSGVVWMYFNNDGFWANGPKLLPSTMEQLGAFGDTVALDGDVLAVVSRKADGAVADSGAVYVFRRHDNGTAYLGDDLWLEEAKLFASDGTNADGFGRSLAIKGNDIIVGAYTDEEPGASSNFNSGSAYLFRYDGESWAEYEVFRGTERSWDDRYGQSVATDGDYMVVGAYRYASSRGKGYTIRLSLGEDCDGNGYPDECDIVYDPDDDNNGNPDNDNNGNGVLDACECIENADCDDTLFCTTDTCNLDTARCERVVADGYCVLSEFCTPDGLTSPFNECQECDSALDPWDWSAKTDGTACTADGNDCTDDECVAGACTHFNKAPGEACGDPSETECDYADVCDGAGACSDNLAQPGTPCGDMTDTICDRRDTCDGQGECQVNIAEAGTDCEDEENLYCDGMNTCDGEGACVGTGDPCAYLGLPCIEGWHACLCSNAEECDDGLFCTGTPSCVNSRCRYSGGPCPDAFVCNEDADQCDCTSTPDCEDDLFCTGVEFCNPMTSACESTGDPCAPDLCDEDNDRCVECFTNEDCSDDLWCNGAELCSGTPRVNDLPVVCEPGTPPCSGGICDEARDRCLDCIFNADCADGLFCNGSEMCVDGDCQESSDPCYPLLCDEDTNTCTGGACCLLDDSCVDGMQEDDCLESGRAFHEGRTCDEVDCVAGACCIGGGCLENLDQGFCEVLNGLFAGSSTVCDDGLCNYGACCLPLGGCAEYVGVECLRVRGTFQGVGTNCDAAECPLPSGACCVWGYCVPDQDRDDCLSVLDAEWAGPTTSCYDDLCPLCDDGDADRDGDVDLQDYAWFQACMGMSGGGDCKCLDANNFDDIDLTDFSVFQGLLNGPAS